MENAVKRIGVLTSGGDAPGMNACIRAVVRSALGRGIECVGIRRGWSGLINGDIMPMDSASVSRIINRGGTMLYTARSEEFRMFFFQFFNDVGHFILLPTGVLTRLSAAIGPTVVTNESIITRHLPFCKVFMPVYLDFLRIAGIFFPFCRVFFRL